MLRKVLEAWSLTPDLHELSPPAESAEIAAAAQALGQPLPSSLAALYLMSNGFEALRGHLQVEPLFGADSGLVDFGDRLRGWGWPIPQELLMIGGTGGDDLLGLWYPENSSPDGPIPVIMVGSVFEPSCLALAGTDLPQFLTAWTAFHLVLLEAPSRALVAIGLPGELWKIDDELGMTPFFSWADPALPDPDPNPYERGKDAAGIQALLETL